MAGQFEWKARGHDLVAAIRAARRVQEAGCTPEEAMDQVLSELRDGPPPICPESESMSAPGAEHPERPAQDTAPCAEALGRYLIAVARIAGVRDAEFLTIEELIDIADVAAVRVIPYGTWKQRMEANR